MRSTVTLLTRAMLPAALLLGACGTSSTSGVATDEAASVPTASPMPDQGGGAERMRLSAPQAAKAGVAGYAAAADADLQLPTATSSQAMAAPMLIRTGSATVEVDSLERAVAAARQLATRAGGYVATEQLQTGRDQRRSGTLELKLPSARFDEIMGGLASLGRVEAVSVGAEDVGEEYTDLDARVANARRLEERLVTLLATRTGKLDDVLSVERELARVREQIERLDGRMRYLRTRVAYSSLTLTVHEPMPLVDPRQGPGPLGEAVRQAWRNFVGVVAALIALVGVIVPLGVLVLAAVLVGRRLPPHWWKPRPTPPTAPRPEA